MTDYQEQINSYIEKQVEANTKLWEVNSQYLEAYTQRQATFVADLVETSSESIKKMGDTGSYSSSYENSVGLGKDVMEKMTALNKENSEAYNTLQKEIVKIFEPLYAAA
ncbi:MAG: phasin family protein [Endozoicomonas sp.]